jgi:hypothetical protein
LTLGLEFHTLAGFLNQYIFVPLFLDKGEIITMVLESKIVADRNGGWNK